MCIYHINVLIKTISRNSDGSGSIDREEFLQIPQIATNPLALRMIAIFDEECVCGSCFFCYSSSRRPEMTINFFLPCLLIDRDMKFVYSGGGTVDFQEFVGGLSAFSSRGGREEKLKCKVYQLCIIHFIDWVLHL